MTDFEDKLAFGKAGEKAVQAWLNSRGWFVLPTYDFNGNGAPAWVNGRCKVVAPDMHVAKAGVSKFVEVKTYAKAVYNRRRQGLVHGVTGRLWSDYLAAVELTGIVGWLVILELDTGEMLARKIDDRETFGCLCGCLNGGKCRAPMKRGVYWMRDTMTLIGKMDDGALALLRSEHVATFAA